MEPAANKAATETPQQKKAEAKRDRRADEVKARQTPKEKPTPHQAASAVAPGILERMKADLKEDLRQEMIAELGARLPERAPPQRDMPYREQRQIAREPARQAVRMQAGADIAFDREGNPIQRRGDTYDGFAVPTELKEKDWDYQWVRISTHGQEDIDNQVAMQSNGWRPVPADRAGWRGRFMAADYKGPIAKSGLMLMERPMMLTEQAKAETDARYREQKMQQSQKFGLALPEGFSAATDRARANTGIKRGQPVATPESMKPSHELEY